MKVQSKDRKGKGREWGRKEGSEEGRGGGRGQILLKAYFSAHLSM